MNIYAYYLPSSPNRLKIGQTSGEVAARVRQQRTGMPRTPSSSWTKRPATYRTAKASQTT